MEAWQIPAEDYKEFLPLEKTGKRVNAEFVKWVKNKYQSTKANILILLNPVLLYANSFRGYDRICSEVNKDLSDEEYKAKVAGIVESKEEEAKEKAQAMIKEFGGSPPVSIKENAMVEAFYVYYKYARIYPAWKVQLMDYVFQNLKKFYIDDLIAKSRSGKQLICECFSFSYMSGSHTFNYDLVELKKLIDGFRDVCRNQNQ
jgi:hypothetical protein